MYVNSISNTNYNLKQPAFSGRMQTSKEALRYVLSENGITQASSKLVKDVDNFFANTAMQLRREGRATGNMEYSTTEPQKGILVKVKPVYQRFKNYIRMEVEGLDYVDSVMINRCNPYDYTYDHAVLTSFGRATSKRYSSMAGSHDKDIETKVNKYIETYLPKILPQRETGFFGRGKISSRFLDSDI